jgi:hypothetical protein
MTAPRARLASAVDGLSMYRYEAARGAWCAYSQRGVGSTALSQPVLQQ